MHKALTFDLCCSSNEALVNAKEQLRRLTQTASYVPDVGSNAYRPSVSMPWAGATTHTGNGQVGWHLFVSSLLEVSVFNIFLRLGQLAV